MHNTIDLKHTQHGWIASFSDMKDRYGTNKWITTAFTRHARGEDVEKALKELNPESTIFIIGG